MTAQIELNTVTFRGNGLNRPECLVTHESGFVFASDWQGVGGVACIAPDGAVRRIEARWLPGNPLRPNGIALEAGGTFLIAHLGADNGGLFRLHPDGTCEPVLLEVDGVPLPPCNFPLIDRKNRIWLTVSTRVVPRAKDYRAQAQTGFIVLIEGDQARIVADGLGYTNECILSADERFLFVNETFARRLTRFSIAQDGSLADRSTVASFGAGTFPDGIALDSKGDLWITSIVSNRVIRVRPDGKQTIMLEEAEPRHVAEVEQAFIEGWMGRRHLDGTPSRTLRNISSLAFGGPNLTQAHLGCLLGEKIAIVEVPTQGALSPSYTAPLGALAR